MKFGMVKTTLALALLGTVAGCKTRTDGSETLASNNSGSKRLKADDRGSASEYDPGPKKDSLWIPLFGSVPNYRKVGKDYTGSEKFRWNIGPMWYRGRLGENQVKVIVVGQEGAQDENTSNRTFTGGTGTKTQNMLRGLEMDRSYLFLNTFVYTIFGQRDTEDKKYMEMEQGADSPIVKYRHQLFDYAAQYNAQTLSMFVAVGGGADDSLVNWIKSRGGKCNSSNINTCDTSTLKIYKQEFGNQNGPNSAGIVSQVDGVRYTNEQVKLANQTLVIGVAHPGQARFEGGLENVQKSFKYAGDKIKKFVLDNKTWLDGQNGRPRPDTGTRDDIIKNFEKFNYQNTKVPFRDFAFGTTWRLGDGGTNTDRDGQDAIVIWADGQEYGSHGKHDLSILGRATRDGKTQNMGRPWEPQRWDPKNPESTKSFDYGPCGYVNPGENCPVAEAMMSWPDFSKVTPKPIQDPSFGTGPSYRGNPNNAAILILADQFNQDDIFTARALTGEVGQRLQTWLKKNGFSNADNDDKNDYVIIRVLPVDTVGMSESDVIALASNADVAAARNRIVAAIKKTSKGTIKAYALGPVAQAIKDSVDGLKFEDLHEGSLPKELTDIDRIDLPYSTRYFMGTTGNRATADGGHHYRFQAPRWSTATPIPQP